MLNTKFGWFVVTLILVGISSVGYYWWAQKNEASNRLSASVAETGAGTVSQNHPTSSSKQGALLALGKIRFTSTPESVPDPLPEECGVKVAELKEYSDRITELARKYLDESENIKSQTKSIPRKLTELVKEEACSEIQTKSKEILSTIEGRLNNVEVMRSRVNDASGCILKQAADYSKERDAEKDVPRIKNLTEALADTRHLVRKLDFLKSHELNVSEQHLLDAMANVKELFSECEVL